MCIPLMPFKISSKERNNIYSILIDILQSALQNRVKELLKLLNPKSDLYLIMHSYLKCGDWGLSERTIEQILLRCIYLSTLCFNNTFQRIISKK